MKLRNTGRAYRPGRGYLRQHERLKLLRAVDRGFVWWGPRSIPDLVRRRMLEREDVPRIIDQGVVWCYKPTHKGYRTAAQLLGLL